MLVEFWCFWFLILFFVGVYCWIGYLEVFKEGKFFFFFGEEKVEKEIFLYVRVEKEVVEWMIMFVFYFLV